MFWKYLLLNLAKKMRECHGCFAGCTLQGIVPRGIFKCECLKNVCCLSALSCKVKVKVAQSCLTLYSPWNSPGQNTGVGSLSLLQGIFPTQGSNPGLSHCRQILYQLSHKGNPRILEWVAYPFSRESSRPRNQIVVSCIAGRFFTNWAWGNSLIKEFGWASDIL